MDRRKVHIFVGEFSYAMNWHAPILHQECLTNNSYNIVVTLPAYCMLYKDFANEVHALPDYIWSRLGRLATIGEHVSATSDITPNYIIEYCKEQFINSEIVLPKYINPFEQNPKGIYNHLSPSIEVKNDIVNFLNDFNSKNTVTVFPKFREKGGAGKQNWAVENWYQLIQTLNDFNFNVVIIQIQDQIKSHGGTYQLDIKSEKVKKFDISRDDRYALDRQSWLLKLTKCSFYGSSGAANLPFWLNTPTCAIMVSQYGQRLLFNWQKKLTNNHEKNKIIMLDDLNSSKFSDIKESIIQYINII